MERNFSGKGGTFVFMWGAVQMQTAETCISFGIQHCCETNQLEGDSKYCKQKKIPTWVIEKVCIHQRTKILHSWYVIRKILKIYLF